MGSQSDGLGLKYGRWTDYDKGIWDKEQWQMGEKPARFVLLLLPVLWGLSARAWGVIIGHCYWHYYHWMTTPERGSPDNDDQQRDNAPLVTSAGQNRSYGGVAERATPTDTSNDQIEAPISTEPPPKRWEYWHYIFQILVLLGWSVGGVFNGARIPKYETGLAGGENCGHYKLLSNASDAQKLEDDRMVQEPKEGRAAYYAKQCYQEVGLVASPDLCGTFYEQSIPSHKKHYNDAVCPFSSSSPEICAEPYAAIQFYTDIFPTSMLGINSPKARYARRKAICSPLSVEEPFVTRSNSEKDGKIEIRYWYGPTEAAGWTFNSFGDPFDSGFPVYAVTTHTSAPSKVPGFWKPREELGHPDGTYLSIFFITTGHIRYQGTSPGYVFNVSISYFEGEPPTQYWRNSDREVRPVACIDSQEYCSSRHGPCHLLGEDTDDPVFELTRRALLRSTIADAIKFRMGRELLAQDMVTQYVSAQLAPNQWEVEFEQLFKASLARMQFNLLDIAVGDGKGRKGYDEVDKDNWGNGKLCGMYKYKLPKRPGGKNLKFVHSVTLVTLFGLLIVLSAPWIWSKNEPAKRPFLGEKIPVYLVVGRLFWKF